MPFRRKRIRPQTAPTPPRTRSLFGAILNWMLLPFVILWPISLVVVYKIAMVLANQPYDASLAQSVRAISRQIQPIDDGIKADFPIPPQALLRDDGEDTIRYQILGPRRELISGTPDVPLGALPILVRSGEVYFRDDLIGGRDVRVGFQFIRLESEPPEWAQVQVAETRNKRNALAYRIIAGVLLPQLAMLPLAVLLVYLGLRRGISPLLVLQQLIGGRHASDLSPIATERIPQEVRPVVSAFNAMMQKLQTNLTAQQRFIADAAHQMRTPLTGLKMQAELALNENDTEHLRKMLPTIATSTNRACHLVNQLLSLARAESIPDAPQRDQRIDLEALVIEAASAMVPQARAKYIDLGLERRGFPIPLAGDPLLLSEMIKNLLDNAIKYTPEGGQVSVRVFANDRAIVEIRDNGIGIPVADRSHVFERFYRVLGTAAEGSGLGLSIVREIARRHDGEVELFDNPAGRGCLALISLPLARFEAANPMPSHEMPKAPTFPKRRRKLGSIG